MNQYEIAVLYDSGLEIDLEKTTSRFEKIIADNKGKILNSDNWGIRKLAYQIRSHDSAVYVIYTVELLPGSVHKVENTLHITDEVIRFLITKPDLKAIAKAEAAKAAKAKRLAEQSESEDEPAGEPDAQVDTEEE
jgi:small subunit ribosomal protein S6